MTEYKNKENYPDPTAYEAIRRLEQEEKKREKIKSGKWFMKWIYVASPYKGDVENNVSNAKRYALFVAKQNLVPVAPHLYLTQFLDDNIETELISKVKKVFDADLPKEVKYDDIEKTASFLIDEIITPQLNE